MSTTSMIGSGSTRRAARASFFIALAFAIIPAADAFAQAPIDAPVAAAAASSAAQAPAGGAAFFTNTELGGLVDAYYDWYSTKQAGIYRNFDTAHNQFTLNMAQLWLAKAPATDSRVGFKIKFHFGPAAKAINFNEPDTNLVNVEEGFVSYLAPVGQGLQFDVGKFVTPAGFEVIEAKDNWNYSRSLLFALAIPYYHAGVRLTYAPNGKVSLMGGVVNGWNNVNENNTGKSVMAGITVKPTGAFTFIENYIGGPEQPGNNDDWRHLSDTILTFTASPMTSFAVNYDYGRDTVAGLKTHWQGIAGYAKFQPNKSVALVPRAEYYDDADGTTTGAAQKLKEFTFTLELKPADNFMWRIEYRGDFSNVSPFADSHGAAKDSQHSLGFGLLYSFSTKQ